MMSELGRAQLIADTAIADWFATIDWAVLAKFAQTTPLTSFASFIYILLFANISPTGWSQTGCVTGFAKRIHSM